MPAFELAFLAMKNVLQQFLEGRVVGVAVPIQQVQGVQLAKAQRQIHGLDAHRHQLVVPDGARTLIAHKR